MRVAIAVPRYGPDVLGGAEVQARGFAEEAVRQGWGVEVWTTCARSHYTWKNVYRPGQERCQDVLVRRFPVTDWDPDLQAELNLRIASRGVLSAADQYRWLESGMHSTPLYGHAVRHAGEFDVIVALPYAMPLTHYVAWTVSKRAVIWPCLHDEPYAYLEPVRLLLESVWGVMFNSPEESDLALRHLEIQPARCAVLGEGVTPSPSTFFDQAETQTNHLLYVGRLEAGKNLSLLYEYVRRCFAEGKNIHLVVLGGGPLEPPSHPAFEYRGFVSEEEKALACASALALCQPSLNESFSLTIMESWLAARPVLVHGECAVTRGHVERSRGGLWFHTYEEFVGAVEWLQANPTLASRMGENGRRYVSSNYSWKAVVDRFERLVLRWKGEDG
jgi:glycosyltransferase involved in cell wall biosynthesis